MSTIRVERIRNGDIFVRWHTYKCDSCGEELPENHPFEEHYINDIHYCGDCAFKKGLITEQEYIKKYCYWIGVEGLRAVIHNGKIHLGTGKFIWERTSRNRESAKYKKWRDEIYERDNYTCKLCKKRGGKLNAHHIRPYALYPELRLDINNGITLCEECHKEIHRKRNK